MLQGVGKGDTADKIMEEAQELARVRKLLGRWNGVNAGDTFLRGDHDKHLWVVISDPALDPENVVIVNLTSLDSEKEQACVLRRGDHPWIRHDTCVNYHDAVIATLEKLTAAKKIKAIAMQARMKPAVLARIRQGVADSQRMSLDVANILIEQGLVECWPGDATVSPKIGYYSLIQYCPDPSRMEAANIGVLVFSPLDLFLQARTATSNRRIIQFFGREGHDWHRINSFKKALHERLTVEHGEINSLEDPTPKPISYGTWFASTKHEALWGKAASVSNAVGGLGRLALTGHVSEGLDLPRAQRHWRFLTRLGQAWAAVASADMISAAVRLGGLGGLGGLIVKKQRRVGWHCRGLAMPVWLDWVCVKGAGAMQSIFRKPVCRRRCRVWFDPPHRLPFHQSSV
jgi:hypothetical protein